MKTKLSILLAALLALLLCASGALAATANASVVAHETVKITAPFAGTLLPFDFAYGDTVKAGDTLFEIDTTKVYAPLSGKVGAVFADVGDDAAGACGRYGAVVVLEPEHPLYIEATTQNAYDAEENRYLHVGEFLYLKHDSDKGTGIVTRVSGKSYTVEILTGSFEMDDTIRCYRESAMPNDSDVGRGRAVRYPDTSVTAAGRIAAMHVKRGDTVKVGDTLFEVIDAQSAPDAECAIQSTANGAITSLNTLSGAPVYRGQLLCEIADLTKLELSAEIDELDLSGIELGEKLSFTLDAYAGETFSGIVTEIRPLGTKKQNATYFDVRITVPTDKTILPGMNATVTLN